MAPVRLRALAIVVMTLTLAACTGDQSVVPTTTPVQPTTQLLLAVHLSATPAGWVPVAYGDAQVSVPPTWVVMTHAWCGGTWPPVVQLGVVQARHGLPAARLPYGSDHPARFDPAPYRQEQPVRLNGISVLLGPKVATSVTYFVPSLHVVLLGSCGSLDPEIARYPLS